MIRILEMSKITYISVIGMVLSIGGWFLWTIILSAVFKARNSKTYFQYPVYQAFLGHYGRDFSWWLNTFLILTALIMYDIAVTSMRKCFWPSDTDVFQELEKDPLIRQRFEETVLNEMDGNDGEVKMGRVDTKTSAEIRREDDIQALLNRPRVMPVSEASPPLSPTASRTDHSAGMTRRRVSTDVGAPPAVITFRHSVDIAEVLGRRA